METDRLVRLLQGYLLVLLYDEMVRLRLRLRLCRTNDVFINHSVNDIDGINDKNDKNVFINHSVKILARDIDNINDKNVFVNDFVNTKVNTKSRKFKFLTGEIGRSGELIKKPDFVNDSVNDFDVISDNTMKPIENKSAVPSWVNDFDETGHSDEIVKKFKFLSDNTMKTKPPDVEKGRKTSFDKSSAAALSGGGGAP